MAVQADENFSVVAAIDFGTYGTGMAMKYTARPDEATICSRHVFPNENVATTKVLTCILVRKSDLETVTYGHSAEERYESMDDRDRSLHLLFVRFKMCLYQVGAHADTLQVAAVCGTLRKAVDVRPPVHVVGVGG